MGLLTEGTPLTWEEIKVHAESVKSQGIVQFINLYHRLKDRTNDQLKWGDEVEYILVHFDDEEKRCQLALRSPDILPLLQRDEHQLKDYAQRGGDTDGVPVLPILHSLWRPEYAAFQVEGTPGQPYQGYSSCFNEVENNMRRRRRQVQQLLPNNQRVLTFTSFPRMGCPNFTYPPLMPTPGRGMTGSVFFPDDAIYRVHPRYGCFTVNTRVRKGMKPDINIPVYRDINTPSPFVENFEQSCLGGAGDAPTYGKPDHIFLDAMGFGNGCCCLQVTFQACNVDEARFLYDQLATLCPLMLALSAGTPIFRGLLADVDVRWQALVETSDDRTDEERGEKPLKENKFRIFKSRYECVDGYISPEGCKYNDVKLIFEEGHVKQMTEAGIDRALAEHVAHLFARDPLLLMSEKIDQKATDTDHFENINSSNWHSLRFKPPPQEPGIGWRVEFRPMEIQMTDFENAAFVTFIVLMTRVILSFDIDFLVPISMVEANMATAQTRDAARQGRFYFRKNILPDEKEPVQQRRASESGDMFKRFWHKYVSQSDTAVESEEYPQWTLNEIFNGKSGDGGGVVEFPGLISLIEEYLRVMDLDVQTSATLQTYLAFIGRRAAGKLLTTASWIRKFVDTHPLYQHDSVISEEINYDLMRMCDAIAGGLVHDDTLLIKHICVPRDPDDS